jgi:hypothetical protein
MPEFQRALCTGFGWGLSITLPLLAWLLGACALAVHNGSYIEDQAPLATLVLAHSLLLVVVTLPLLRYTYWTACLAGAASLLLVPLPLYVLLWATGAAELPQLAAAALLIATTSLAACGVYRCCTAYLSSLYLRSLAMRGGQLALCLALWLARGELPGAGW